MKSAFLRRWLQTVFGAKCADRASRGPPRRRALCLEALEDRSLLSGMPTMVLDINPGNASSAPDGVVATGSTTYFTADDGINGRELWQSDGTAAGTTLVMDIYAGSSPYFDYWGNWAYDIPNSSYPSSLTNVNGTLFFEANDGTNGWKLWKSDDTGGGAVLVSSLPTYPHNLTDVNGTLFFRAWDGTNGWELWKSDGTEAGTTLVKDINPGDASSYPSHLTNVNETLFFTANNGSQLWKSDGTAAGTVLVKDIRPAGASAFPIYLTNVNGALFFTASNGTSGWDLWRTDGTTAGTVQVNPGGASSYPRNPTSVNSTLFFNAYDDTNGHELWKSDGSAAGTVLVKDIRPGGIGSHPSNLTDVNGTLFFMAGDGSNGHELWKSDGSAAGTVLVKDINPGSASSYPSNLTNVNGTLFFSAADGAGTSKLWQSDGTAAGTVVVANVIAGSLTNVNGRLFFTGYDEVHGAELWMLAAGPAAPPAIVINNVSQEEGNVGATAALFTVRLSAASSETISLQYTTADGSAEAGSAEAGSDYQAASGTLTIPAGQTSGTITVLLNGDRLGEPNETFSVNLSGAVNATIADGQALSTIVDDEPRVSINDVTKLEGNSGTTPFVFTVSLSVAYDELVTVSYATANGTATAGSDYQAASGTLTFAPGESSKTLTVAVYGDRLAEPNQTFFVNLSGASTNALIVRGQGVGTILDDEPSISISDVTKSEGKRGKTTLFIFTVTLSAAYDQAVTMSYSTVNGTATTSNNDYVAKTGTLTFAPGETTKTITVEVKGDRNREGDETFYLDLFNLSSNALFTKNRGIGTILNDD